MAAKTGQTPKGRIGTNTGGGHVAPWMYGLAGEAVAAEESGYDVVGFFNGWAGPENNDEAAVMTDDEEFMQQARQLRDLVYSDKVERWLEAFYNDKLDELEPGEREQDILEDFYRLHIGREGGSSLYTSRTNPNRRKVVRTLEDNDIDAMIALGGDDTLGVLADLEDLTDDVLTAGWPKTMDNDLRETEFTLGYPTAVKVASEEVYEERSEAETANRIVVVSPFGRYSDWVAGGSAARGGADIVVPAEVETDLDQITELTAAKCEEKVEKHPDRYTNPYAIVVVAEGAKINGMERVVDTDETGEFGHPKLKPSDMAKNLSDHLSNSVYPVEKASSEPFTYQLRNGAPKSLIDAVMAFKLGEKCVDLIDNGKSGRMATVEIDDQGRLYEGSADIAEASKSERLVKEEPEPMIDYETLEPTEAFSAYLRQFLPKLETEDSFHFKRK